MQVIHEIMNISHSKGGGSYPTVWHQNIIPGQLLKNYKLDNKNTYNIDR